METDELIKTLEKAIENEENIAKKFLLIFAKEKIEELDILLGKLIFHVN